MQSPISLAAAELLPGPKWEEQPDPVLDNFEDQRAWVGLKDPSLLTVNQALVGMPEEKLRRPGFVAAGGRHFGDC